MTENYYQQANGCLKNKLGIEDPQVLRYLEYKEVDQNQIALLKNADNVKTDSFEDIARVHRYLFGDIYDWAGKTRDNLPGHPDLQKSDHRFLPSGLIGNSTQWINTELSQTNAKKKPDKLDYANLLLDINQAHPFYEGNGRATKTFLQALANHHGQNIKYPRRQKELIQAMDAQNPEMMAKFIDVDDIENEGLAKTTNKSAGRSVSNENTLDY